MVFGACWKEFGRSGDFVPASVSGIVFLPIIRYFANPCGFALYLNS